MALYAEINDVVEIDATVINIRYTIMQTAVVDSIERHREVTDGELQIDYADMDLETAGALEATVDAVLRTHIARVAARGQLSAVRQRLTGRQVDPV